jgi:hypothetical protein
LCTSETDSAIDTSVEINPAQTRVSSLVDIKISLGAAAALDAIWQRSLLRPATPI